MTSIVCHFSYSNAPEDACQVAYVVYRKTVQERDKRYWSDKITSPHSPHRDSQEVRWLCWREKCKCTTTRSCRTIAPKLSVTNWTNFTYLFNHPFFLSTSHDFNLRKAPQRKNSSLWKTHSPPVLISQYAAEHVTPTQGTRAHLQKHFVSCVSSRWVHIFKYFQSLSRWTVISINQVTILNATKRDQTLR